MQGGRSAGRVVAILSAWAAFAMGAVALVVAFSAASWPGSPLDGTQALQLGISGGFGSALLVTVAAAAALAPRSTGRAAGALVSTGIGALGLAIAAVSSLPFLESASPLRWAGLLAAVACGGVVLALLVHRVVRGSQALRSAAAAASGAGYVVSLGIAVTFASALLAPVAALLVAIWVSRPPRTTAQQALA